MALEARQVWLVSLALVATGCITTAGEESPEVVSPASAPAPVGLRNHPIEIPFPAGSSFTAAWLDVGPDDWYEDGAYTWLSVGYQFADDADVEASSFMLFEVEGDELVASGLHLGTGAGAGSNGQTGEREVRRFIGVVIADGVSSPTSVRMGIFDAFPDFELEGEPREADIVASGDGHFLSWFMDFASPPLSDGAFVHNVEVSDGRIATPAPVAVVGVGAIELTAKHVPTTPSIQVGHAYASAFLGVRAGTWAVSSVVDGETSSSEGTMLGTPGPGFGPFVFTEARVLTESTLSMSITSADASYITSLAAVTVPLDVAALGLTFEPRFTSYKTLPVAFHTPTGCLVGSTFTPGGFCKL